MLGLSVSEDKIRYTTFLINDVYLNPISNMSAALFPTDLLVYFPQTCQSFPTDLLLYFRQICFSSYRLTSLQVQFRGPRPQIFSCTAKVFRITHSPESNSYMAVKSLSLRTPGTSKKLSLISAWLYLANSTLIFHIITIYRRRRIKHPGVRYESSHFTPISIMVTMAFLSLALSKSQVNDALAGIQCHGTFFYGSLSRYGPVFQHLRRQ